MEQHKVKVERIIVSEIIRGKGTGDDPFRMVTRFHSIEGDFLAENDPLMMPVYRPSFDLLRKKAGAFDGVELDLRTLLNMLSESVNDKKKPSVKDLREVLEGTMEHIKNTIFGMEVARKHLDNDEEDG